MSINVYHNLLQSTSEMGTEMGTETGLKKAGHMKTNKLTAREVESTGVGKHGDGGGLWLRVRANGSRAWVFRFTHDGRNREMGLGALERLPLAAARRRAQAARELLAVGKDPIAERRAQRRAPTFREAGAAYIERHEVGWSNPKHRKQWASTLKTYAFPILGSTPVDRITTSDILRCLNPIWGSKTETASRLRGRIEKILDWSTAQGLRTGENPARWRGHLATLLPAPSKLREVRHHAAMDWQLVPNFMVKLKEQTGIAARALEFAVLTAGRSGEVREATWEEIDLDAGTWTIPGERMKAGKPHRVPLSPPTVELLQNIPRFEGSRCVFPSPYTGRPLSDSALGKVLKDMMIEVTAHGFRSSFRDWAAERTSFQNIVCEQALAHAIGDKTEAAYRRGDLYTKRVKLMEAWSVFCTSPAPAGKVVPIRERKSSGR